MRRFFYSVLMICILWACNKSKNTNGNKAYIAITNTAPGSPPVDVIYNGSSLLSAGPLPYDSTLPAYTSAVAGVHDLKIANAATVYQEGNTAFQEGAYYSLFVYDTLTNGRLKTFIFQDTRSVPADTMIYMRFINFSPGTYLDLLFTNATDTASTGFKSYAGNDNNPAHYSFALMKAASYGVIAIIDSTHAYTLDSLNFYGGHAYTVYLKGIAGRQGVDSLGIKSIFHY